MSKEVGNGNLIPNSQRSPEELRAMTRKGGINSGKARRDKRKFREILTELLAMAMIDGKGKQQISPVTGKAMSIRETIITSVLRKAINGDHKAVQTILDVTGEKLVKIENEITVKKDKYDLMSADELNAEAQKIIESMKD